MKHKGKNITNVKNDNRALVLKLVCTGQCVSRIEVARKTGLSKMTVTNIVNDLIQDGLLMDGELCNNNMVGRNPIPLLPDTRYKRVIGVYIGRDKVTVSSITLQAKISCTQEFLLSNATTALTLMDGIIEEIHRTIISEPQSNFIGIGVACIGPLDIENGILLSPLDFYGIHDIRIKQILENATGLPVILNNDMNAAALAEMLYGSGSGCNNFIYVGLTHGIGSGIVQNGALYAGSKGYKGELGHVSIDYQGPTCSCGNKGCLEVYASMPNLIAEATDTIEKIGSKILVSGEKITFRDLIKAADAGDPASTQVLDLFYIRLSTGLLGMIHLINPEKIFIGHESAQGGDLFAERLEYEINHKSLFRDISAIKVHISAFGDVSPVIGSGVIFLESLF